MVAGKVSECNKELLADILKHGRSKFLQLLPVGGEELDPVAPGLDGVPGDHLAPALLGRASTGFGGDELTEDLDVAANLAGREPVGQVVGPAALTAA